MGNKSSSAAVPGSSSSSKMSGEALRKAQAFVAQNAVVVFSKTWCPYCRRVKEVFSSLGVKPAVMELDTEADGDAVQAALASWTGQRTVPSVFIKQQHIGGCDDTIAAQNSGKLGGLLKDAGVVA